MISFNDKISLRQFQILLILNLMGTNLIVLPRKVGVFALEDTPVAIIIGVCFACISMILIIKASSIYEKKTFSELLEIVFRKPISKIILLLFVIKIICTMGLELRVFTEMVNEVMLNKTPINLIGVIMLITCGIMASKGLEARARLAEILFSFVFLFLIINLVICFYNTDFTNLLPILKNPAIDTFKGSIIVFLSFSTIEYTFLIYKNVSNKTNFKKSSIKTILFVGLIFIFISIVSIGRYTATGLTKQLYPVLELMNSISIAGSFIERQDVFIMSFWIFMVFASTSAGIYFSTTLMHDIVKKGKHYHYVILSMIFCFIISIIPPNIKIASFTLETIYLFLSTFYMIILPILILFTYFIRKGEVPREK